MNPDKRVVHMQAVVLAPIAVGNRAILSSGGRVILTSKVVAVHTQTDEKVCFETLNTNDCVTMVPFPLAGAAALPMYAAA